jgi:hypothetical protein
VLPARLRFGATCGPSPRTLLLLLLLVQREYNALLDIERRRLVDEVTLQASASLRASQQEILSRVGAESARRLAALDELATSAEAADTWLSEREAYEQHARRVHKLALCSLALLQRAARPGPMSQEAAALYVASGGDHTIQLALSLLPPAAHSAAGVPTLYDLQVCRGEIESSASCVCVWGGGGGRRHTLRAAVQFLKKRRG